MERQQQYQSLRNPHYLTLQPHQPCGRSADYLRDSMGAVQRKIRNKLLRQKVDFAEGGRGRAGVGRYDPAFEEELIRRRISGKSHTLPEEESGQWLPGGAGGRARSLLEAQAELGSRQGRLIVVSRMSPQHALAKFKSLILETARRPLSKSEEAEVLLRRYVNRHFREGVRSFQQRSLKQEEGAGVELGVRASPVGCVRARVGPTALRRELRELRRESVGLPLLLEGECPRAEWEEGLRSCKAGALPQPSRKKVVFSRRHVVLSDRLEEHPP